MSHCFSWFRWCQRTVAFYAELSSQHIHFTGFVMGVPNNRFDSAEQA